MDMLSRIVATLLVLLLAATNVFGFIPAARSSDGKLGKLSVQRGETIHHDDHPVSFRVDPGSPYANSLMADHLGLSEEQRNQVEKYCYLILEWNKKINLVSRKCSIEDIFGRHVLPCLSPIMLEDGGGCIQVGDKVVDVGTGGGLPGIPLAICFPEANFLLVDSVGKKLKAVDDVIDQLQLTNVKTQHSRAEQATKPKGGFDWCVGRSVASLPKFCGWMHHLLKPESGRLLYIIGGDVPESSIAHSDHSVHDLLSNNEIDLPNGAVLISEKRLLVFPQEAVEVMAAASDTTAKNINTGKQRQPKERKSTVTNHNTKKKRSARGAWQRRDNEHKTRGYEDFQRYSPD